LKPGRTKPGSQRQFSDGEICISVDALYIPPNETADLRTLQWNVPVPFNFVQEMSVSTNTENKVI